MTLHRAPGPTTSSVAYVLYIDRLWTDQRPDRALPLGIGVTSPPFQLATQPDQVLLVLDDYHLVEAQPVHASLEFLLQHRPTGLLLVLISRADPPLGLARLRAHGQLAELREADLRFTAEEAAMLREAVGPGLTDAAVAALAARTEGWAAGSRPCRCGDNPTSLGSWRRFSGSHATCWTI